MKKVLISAYIKRDEHIRLMKGLISMLGYKKYKIDIIINDEMPFVDNDIHLVSSKENKNKTDYNYDIIIAFNKNGYNNIKRIKNIPMFYSFCLSDLTEEYLFPIGKFCNVIIFNNSKFIFNNLCNNDYTSIIKFPFEILKINHTVSNKLNNIIVDVCFEVLLTLLPIINDLLQYNFIIITDRKVECLLNPNISTTSLNTFDNKTINFSKLIICHGSRALEYIQYNSNIMIVGNYGFGGMININNFVLHYNNCFSGRIGAEYGEFIPYSLVKNEIIRATEAEPQIHPGKDLKGIIEKTYKTVALSLNNVIKPNIIDDIWKATMQVSNMFLYTKSIKGSYFVTDLRFGSIVFSISQKEYDIIMSFKNATTLNNAFAKLNKYQKKNWEKCISDFLLKNLLIRRLKY